LAIGKTFFLLGMLVASSCKPDLSDDPIPIVFFPNATINLNLPDYSALKVDGGYKSVGSVGGTSVGVRGIILYRQSATNYYAYEANCSYHPNEAGSTVSIHPSGLFMMCSGCGSNFSFTDGAPTGGIAWRPLRKYQTVLDGFNLTITNDVVN
jgi:nitrite reductase/ring-hydroxylating ferredoxin subunit